MNTTLCKKSRHSFGASAFGVLLLVGLAARCLASPELFIEQTIDYQGVNASWGKSVGDINNDGLLDLVVGGNRPPILTTWERIEAKLGLYQADKNIKGELVWYENPSWERHVISQKYSIRTDIEVGDIDNDGKNDIVITTNQGIFWLKAPLWQAQLIDSRRFHDVELADLDRDGDLEIIARNQSLFGYNNGNAWVVFEQDEQHGWGSVERECPHGEGLIVADMNGDEHADIVVNGVWYENPKTNIESADWKPHSYAADWSWENVFIDVGDFNNDGRKDVLLSPSEKSGQTYDIAWFEAPSTLDAKWKKHIVDKGVDADHHFVAARDVNRDGALDVLTAEMNQGADPDEVKVYLNEMGGGWKKLVLSTAGSHSMRAVDIDNDFDIDLFGAQWQKKGYREPYPVSLWRNQVSDQGLWPKIVIDSDRSGQATSLHLADIDGDGLKDIVSGAYWYKSPGNLKAQWRRSELGLGADDVALLYDFDRDGDLDFIASGWKGYGYQRPIWQRIKRRLGYSTPFSDNRGERFVWGENDGSGNFTIHSNLEAAHGDFLQGASVIEVGGQLKVALSWHNEGGTLQALSVPSDPKTDLWRWQELSKTSQDEKLNTADLDGDGLEDLVLGTKWLKQLADGNFSTKMILGGKGKPDRNTVADINQDGKLDVVVGFEAVNKKGKLAWYEQTGNAETPWREHVLSEELFGPMSLSVFDLDRDGDMDVVVGEHRIKNPERARLVWLENLDGVGKKWRLRLLAKGEEHHDGAIAADLDGDGDKDIVSIGWTHSAVTLYENPGNY